MREEWYWIPRRYLNHVGVRHAWCRRTGRFLILFRRLHWEFKVRFQWRLSWTWDFICVHFRFGLGVDWAQVKGGMVEVRQLRLRRNQRLCLHPSPTLRPKVSFGSIRFCCVYMRPRRCPQKISLINISDQNQ